MGELPEGSDYKDFLNPDSVKVLKGAKLEASLADAKPGEKFQFVRMGYRTPYTTHPVVSNSSITLKDSSSKTLVQK